MAKIMIVDDDDDFSNALSLVVKGAGHEVVRYSNTEDAHRALLQSAPDLLVLDVMFPENDSEGFEFARKLQQERIGQKKIPILMLTAINKKSQLGFSAKDIDDSWLPVDEFIEKPVDFFVFQSKVNLLLSKYGGYS